MLEAIAVSTSLKIKKLIRNNCFFTNLIYIEVFNHGTIDILGQIILFCGGLSCMVGYLAVPLTSTHKMPEHFSIPSMVTIKSIQTLPKVPGCR